MQRSHDHLLQSPWAEGLSQNDQIARAPSDADGFFDTGDLGYVVPPAAGPGLAVAVVLVGRAKDTIVLSPGENVEPGPVEELRLASPLIRQVMCAGGKDLNQRVGKDLN